MYDGTISDYPFDHYRADIALLVQDGGQIVPTRLVLGDIDPFYRLSDTAGGTDQDVVHLTERVSRSRGTLLLAWFIEPQADDGHRRALLRPQGERSARKLPSIATLAL